MPVDDACRCLQDALALDEDAEGELGSDELGSLGDELDDYVDQLNEEDGDDENAA